MMSELPKNQVLFGNCLEVMKTLPDNSIDCVVSDPPYGLGTKQPTREDIIAYLQGASLGPLKKGRKYCANRILGAPIVPESDHVESEEPEALVTFRVVVPQLPVVSIGAVDNVSPVLKLDD